jgi:site-specific DNA recombinase
MARGPNWTAPRAAADDWHGKAARARHGSPAGNSKALSPAGNRRHKAQDLLDARRGTSGPHKPHKSRHAYALRGLLFCGVCERRMQGHWANAAPYYRWRFPAEYALANRLHHPLNVSLRQDALLDPLDEWLASKFEPRHLPATIDELAAAAASLSGPSSGEDQISAKLAECDRKLNQYRATLDAEGEPATVARWITETEAERAKYQVLKRATPPQTAPSMSGEDISSMSAPCQTCSP